MIITLIYEWWTPLQIPGQKLISIHILYISCKIQYHSNSRWVGKSWVKWFSLCFSDMLLRPSPLLADRRTLKSSCVSELTSILQTLEVGLLQDAVDLQVGPQVCRAGKFWKVTRAEGTVGAHNTLTATAPSCMFWTADATAALTVGWLRFRCQH